MSDAATLMKQIKDDDIDFVDLRFTDPAGKWTRQRKASGCLLGSWACLTTGPLVSLNSAHPRSPQHDPWLTRNLCRKPRPPVAFAMFLSPRAPSALSSSRVSAPVPARVIRRIGFFSHARWR